MKKIITKTHSGRDGDRTTSAISGRASLSARDELAYAAALKILG